jgi:antitoxin component of MazEF toxin-antitoxin module
MRVSRLGNSLVVRLPASIVTSLELKPGDEVDMRAADDKAVVIARAPDPKELLETLRQLRVKIPKTLLEERKIPVPPWSKG